jgi:putative acetyltransferase
MVRPEIPGDEPAIGEVTIAAFADLDISGHTEQYVIRALRDADALTVSLVAELDGRIVGHLALSPVAMSDGSPGWYGLGPMSVYPDLFGRGIGSTLVHEGLSRLRTAGAKGCCLVGHPGYYPRFGFRNTDELVHPGVPEEVFFVLPFDSYIPDGTVEFHEAFAATS